MYFLLIIIIIIVVLGIFQSRERRSSFLTWTIKIRLSWCREYLWLFYSKWDHHHYRHYHHYHRHHHHEHHHHHQHRYWNYFTTLTFWMKKEMGYRSAINVLFHKRSRVENKFSVARITELLSLKESGSYNLRSNSSYEFKVPNTKCKTLGDRTFARVGPSLWNTLPLVIRSIRSVQVSSRSSESIRAQWLLCCIFIFSKCTVCYVSNVCQLLSAF